MDDTEEQPRKPRRRIKLAAVAVALVLALLLGELLVSRKIASKLRHTVESKLDAQLELGPLVYLPPLGAWVWGSKITRHGDELFSFSSAKISLAELPLGGGDDKPIIISRLDVHQPVLNLAPGRFKDIKKPQAKTDDKPPRKFSGMLRLKHVRVTDGQVTYRDLKRPSAPPTVWGNLALDVDTIQKSPSRYTFHLVSRAAPIAEMTAAGSIDVDELLLDVQSSSLKVRAEPEPVRSPLPAAVQEFIRQRKINGQLTVSGNGKVPLRDPRQSYFSAAIGLQNARATLPPSGATLDHARASIVARMSPGGPITVRVDRVDVAGAGKQVIVKGGQGEINTAAGTWSVADLSGELLFKPPGTNAVALGPPPAIQADPPPPAPAPPEEPRGIDKLAIAGKGDFTVTASGPFDPKGKNPWQAIRHEVIVTPHEASFLPKHFASRIEGIGGGEIRLQDGMIIFQELEAHYGEDILRLRSARLPVDGLPKLARWQEISGTVIFKRPVRRYAPALDKILEPLNPHGPFLIAGSYVVDKRALDAEGKGKNTFDLIISSDSGSFSLTGRQIVLEKMRGDATVTNDGVDVHELEAEVLDGTIRATGRWDREKERSGYIVDADLRDVDLALLEDRLREEPAVKPMEGRVYAAVSLQGLVTKGAGRDENLRALKGNGEVEVVRGSLFQMPVIKNVTQQIKGLKGAANVGDGAALFEINDGTVKLGDAAVSSSIVGLQGGGTMSLDGKHVDLRVVAAPLADWKENLKDTKIPVVSDVAGAVAGGIQKMLNAATGTLLYEFRVQGSLDEHEVIAVPTPVLTDAAAFVFGRMLNPEKDQRPLHLLRRDNDRDSAPRAETR